MVSVRIKDTTMVECILCKKVLASKNSLNVHMKTHDDKKEFSCDTCGKEFALKAHLQRHNLIHTGAKPYKCEDCGKNSQGRML